jgi:AraC-like DNA-binding protein
MAGRIQQNNAAGIEQYRGIYLKRIPTFSFPLMLEVMQEQGVAAASILKNTGLEATDLAMEGTLVSFLQALKFVRNILKHSPLADIGLHIGDRYHVSTYGVLGYAMMSCGTWGDALALGRRFHQVASSLANIDLDIDQRRNTLSYIATPFYPELTDIEPFIVEKLFASLIAASRSVLREPAYPSRVSFTYSEPEDAVAYREIFPCPIEFDARENRFEMDMAPLRQPLLAANEVCAAMGRRMCEEYLGQYEQTDDSVRRRVADLLLSSPHGMPRMDAVADALHMSSRTLRRLLLVEGATFQEICDELRHDLSKQYLRGSQLSLDEIAHLVGFTESTNFRRAFKRWQGLPPAQYRRQQQQQLLYLPRPS